MRRFAAAWLWLASGLAAPSLLAHPVLALATAGQVSVHRLSLPKGAFSAVVSGINDHGVAVGTSRASSTQSGEVWVLRPSGAERKRIDVPPPRGFESANLNGVNESGVAVGSVLSPPDQTGSDASYPAYLRGKAWTILSEGTAQPSQGDATGIASNGVISADVWNPSLAGLAAATFWLGKSGHYRFHFLPLDSQAINSDASAAFSVGTITIVGGYEQVRGPGEKVDQLPVVWINGKGPLRIDTSLLNANQRAFAITGIYGASESDMTAAGIAFQNDNGVTATQPFAVHISAAGRKPILGRAKSLPLPQGATFGWAASIGGVPGKGSMAYTVGGNISDWAGATGAALWGVTSDGSRLTVRSFTDLNQSDPGASTCPMYQIESISAQGNAVGYSYCNYETYPISVYIPR